MARRRGRGGSNRVDSDLGVGALAGDLQHGERQVVEDLAPPAPGGGQPGPAQPVAGGQPAPQPPQGGASADLWAPSGHQREPITAGLPMGPGPSQGSVMGDDPDETLRALYQAFPHDDIRALLEAREF